MPSIDPANDWREQLVLGWHSGASISPIAALDNDMFICNAEASPQTVSSVKQLLRADIDKGTLLCIKELLAQEKKDTKELQQILSSVSGYGPSLPDHVRTITWRSLSTLFEENSVVSDGSLLQILNHTGMPSENCVMGKHFMSRVFDLIADWLIEKHKDVSVQHVQQYLANHVTRTKESIVMLLSLSVYRKVKSHASSTGFHKSITDFATTTAKTFAGTSFPKASESREEYETFLASCVPCAQAGLLHLNTVRSWLQESFEKTFQSIAIMRSLIQILSAIQMSHSSPLLQAEIIAAYRVFAQYTEKEKVQSHSKSLDAGLLDTCSLAINAVIVKDNLKDDTAIPFLKSRIEEMESIFEKYSLSGDLAKPLASRFIEWNHSLYLAHKALCRISSDIYHIDMAFKYAETYFPHVELECCSDPILVSYCYEYALLLARNSYFKKALKIIQMIVLKCGKNASSFKYWNFFLLLLSTVEEKQSKSLEVAKKVDSELFEFVTKCDPSGLSMKTKRELLQVSMTCVEIFERANDVYNALDALPQVFAVFRALFVVGEQEEKPEQDGRSLHSKNDTSLKKKISHAFSHEKSRKKEHHRHSKLPSSHASSLALPEKKLLMELWLWASVLYEKADLLNEAESCVTEAETCYHQCSSTLSRMAMLVSHKDPNRAMRLFESSLELNAEKNLESVVGLCHLYLKADSSSQDTLSALSRLKFHLITFTAMYEAMQVSEVYYCLSQIYERFGDEDQMVENLEKCLYAEPFRFVREVIQAC